MMDQRRVRFSSLGLLTRDDLPLAVDVWLGDAVNAPWASKDTMKIAGILAQYILDPKTNRLSLSTIENLHHVQSDATRRALGTLSLFGLISAFSTANGDVRAALRLSQIQMLRILEVKERLAKAEGAMREGFAQADPSSTDRPVSPPAPEPCWFPDQIEIPATCDPIAELPTEDAASGHAALGRTASLLRQRMAEAIRQEQSANQADDAPARPQSTTQVS